MYHHVNSDRCSNDLAIFEEHLKYIKNNFKTIFPGEEITSKSVCLTFDDAYADFYFLIFPLLKKYNLKALLAIPSKYILDDIDEEGEFIKWFYYYQGQYHAIKDIIANGKVR